MRTLVQDLQRELSRLISIAWSNKSTVPHTQNHHPMYWLNQRQCLRMMEIQEKLKHLDVRNPPDDGDIPY